MPKGPLYALFLIDRFLLFVDHEIYSIDDNTKRKRFTDLYRSISHMNITINRKHLQFYLWVGLAYLLLFLFSEFVSHPDSFLIRAVNTCWRTIYIVTINIICFEYALPAIRITRKKILRSILIVVGLFLLYTLGVYFWREIGILLRIHTPLVDYESVSEGTYNQLCNGIGSFFFFGILKHIYNYRNLRITTQQLRIEKQEAELNYLKSQTNPHFLFNTLNNIYSLARDKSDLAPESILRLSKILRFMLYEAGGEYIALEQELKIISDYIALEELRYDESLRVNFNHNIEEPKQAIPPLLLIPLVENAFKHGVSETRSQPFVDIHLSVNQRQLAFSVKNSSEKLMEEGTVRESIGLSNLRRQLELLYTDYSLTVQQGETVFTALLKINLASHV